MYFRVAQVPADGTYPRHRHRWGEFVYAFSGVMEVEVSGASLTLTGSDLDEDMIPEDISLPIDVSDLVRFKVLRVWVVL